MRIDKFMNSVNMLKTRNMAQDMCDNGVVLLNGAKIKQSKNVKIGDTITLVFLEKSKRYLILDLPKTKNIPKSQSHLYIKEVL